MKDYDEIAEAIAERHGYYNDELYPDGPWPDGLTLQEIRDEKYDYGIDKGRVRYKIRGGYVHAVYETDDPKYLEVELLFSDGIKTKTLPAQCSTYVAK